MDVVVLFVGGFSLFLVALCWLYTDFFSALVLEF